MQTTASLTRHYLRWLPLSFLCGLLAGISATVFLNSLAWITEFHEQHAWALLAFLPIGGFLIGLLYHYFGKEASGGGHLILDEIHEPKNILPVRMAPLVLIGTLVTHLFGGSAGREGAAVQISASLSAQLNHFFKELTSDEKKILLIAGAGAGFAAAIGTPWAGVLFGMEVVWVGRLKPFAVVECIIASFTGCFVTHLLHAHHSVFPSFELPDFQISVFASVILASILFGLIATLFVRFTHLIENLNRRFIQWPPLRPVFAGFILIGLTYWVGSLRYNGLGIAETQDAILHPANLRDPFLKTLFTSLTVGSGFKGGEFVPLVFIGATLGSFLSVLLPVSCALLGALGFASVFGAAANTPITCAVMAMELWGWKIGIYAFPACWVAYYCSAHSGIYHTQRISNRKDEGMIGFPRRTFSSFRRNKK